MTVGAPGFCRVRPHGKLPWNPVVFRPTAPLVGNIYTVSAPPTSLAIPNRCRQQLIRVRRLAPASRGMRCCVIAARERFPGARRWGARPHSETLPGAPPPAPSRPLEAPAAALVREQRRDTDGRGLGSRFIAYGALLCASRCVAGRQQPQCGRAGAPGRSSADAGKLHCRRCRCAVRA